MMRLEPLRQEDVSGQPGKPAGAGHRTQPDSEIKPFIGE